VIAYIDEKNISCVTKTAHLSHILLLNNDFFEEHGYYRLCIRAIWKCTLLNSMAMRFSFFDMFFQSCISGRTANRCLSLLAFTVILLCLAIAGARADDLFDYQLKLAREGDAEAQFNLGEMYETGLGVRKNRREAVYWTTRSANQGHEIANFKLLYWDMERKGLEGENIKKVEELNSKAKSGNAQAQLYLGRMYAYGVGVNKNTGKAIDLLNKASSAGVLEAELELASLQGEGVQQEAEPAAKKDKGFKSDPCSGKAARFLSTCK
jgi:TPR repeat protein